MKLLSKILLLVLVTVLFSSCDGLNEVPKFSDANAYVAFSGNTAKGVETQGSLTIPVTLASVKGIENIAYYSIKSNTAKEGVHFTVAGNGSLTFSKDVQVANIQIDIIDNDIFEGDINFTIELSDPGSVDLGYKSKIVVTIEDDEHPLAAMLGDFNAQGTSYFNGPTEWVVSISKDKDDLKKVWISNFVQGGSNKAVYGIVNDEKTEMRVPVKQEIATSASYPQVLLEGFYGPNGEVDIPDGGYITIQIDLEAGKLTVMDEFGSAVYNANKEQLGFFNAFAADVVLQKK